MSYTIIVADYNEERLFSTQDLLSDMFKVDVYAQKWHSRNRRDVARGLVSILDVENPVLIVANAPAVEEFPGGILFPEAVEANPRANLVLQTCEDYSLADEHVMRVEEHISSRYGLDLKIEHLQTTLEDVRNGVNVSNFVRLFSSFGLSHPFYLPEPTRNILFERDPDDFPEENVSFLDDLPSEEQIGIYQMPDDFDF